MKNYFYGQWCSHIDFDPHDYMAFVYILTLSNGKKYIGSKKFWSSLPKPPSTYSRRTNFTQSNWLNYCSSSHYIADLLVTGDVVVDKYHIISLHTSWGKALDTEARLQLLLNTASSTEWLNEQVEGHFGASTLDPNFDEILRNVQYMYFKDNFKYIAFKVGKLPAFIPEALIGKYKAENYAVLMDPIDADDVYKPMTSPYTYQITNGYETIVVNAETILDVIKKTALDFYTLGRLKSGDLLDADGWRRADRVMDPIFRICGKDYKNLDEAKDDLNMTKTQLNKFIKDPKLKDYLKIKPESKAEFQKRILKEILN